MCVIMLFNVYNLWFVYVNKVAYYCDVQCIYKMILHHFTLYTIAA